MTITVDVEVARWARIKAATEANSVSRMVGDMLKERMRKDEGYETAMKRYLAIKPSVISKRPYPTRAESHERSRSR